MEYIKVPIHSENKKFLQRLADDRGKSLEEVAKVAIQSYVFALRSKKRRVKREGISQNE